MRSGRLNPLSGASGFHGNDLLCQGKPARVLSQSPERGFRLSREYIPSVGVDCQRWSQSPERGFRLSRLDRVTKHCAVMGMTSQSPERGFRLSRAQLTISKGYHSQKSQSPERGFRLSRGYWVVVIVAGILVVSIP